VRGCARGGWGSSAQRRGWRSTETRGRGGRGLMPLGRAPPTLKHTRAPRPGSRQPRLPVLPLAHLLWYRVTPATGDGALGGRDQGGGRQRLAMTKRNANA